MAKKYQAVGCCIYCGTTTEKLSDEHIVPFSLQGKMVLPKSTCGECAKRTSAIEHYCARPLYGQFRIRAGLQTRRPEKRPTSAKAFIKTAGSEYEQYIPEQAAISLFPIFRLQPPGILRSPREECTTWAGAELKVRSCGPRDTDYWRSLPSGDISFEIRFDIDKFALMCAKIGHSFAVAEFGTTGFNHWLPPHILGQQVDGLPILVGGACDDSSHTGNVAYSLKPALYGTRLSGLLAVTVHLFPGFGQPPVNVVVGSTTSTQYDWIASKLRAQLAG